MKTSCIEIAWNGSVEYVPLNVERLPAVNNHVETADYWIEEDEAVDYVARCEVASLEGGQLNLRLAYHKEDNADIVGRSDVWGIAELHVNVSTGLGNASWQGADGDSRYDGDSAKCMLLDDALFDEIQCGARSFILRPKQAAVRRQLLRRFTRCALTEEETHAALEVAHLIPASEAGAATIANCILLRADIHRLFDSNLLRFDAAGKVILSPRLSERYRRELSGKSLRDDALLHVRAALRRAQ